MSDEPDKTDPEVAEALAIVRGLRSSRMQEVDKAMQTLYGKEPAVLVIARPLVKVGICNGQMNSDVFVALLNVSQKLGNALGLQLQWVQQQPAQQQTPAGVLLPGSKDWVR
jgi:hypothetical protein